MKTENLSITDRMRLKNVKQLENIFMDIVRLLEKNIDFIFLRRLFRPQQHVYDVNSFSKSIDGTLR